MTYPRFQRARDFKVKSRTSGSYTTLNNTNWTDLDTSLDLVLRALAGDVIEVGVNSLWDGAVTAYLDVATIVSSAPVNYFGGASGTNTGFGVSGWHGAAANPNTCIGPSTMRTLVSGDVSGGTVTLRLRFRTASASNKTLYAQSTLPLVFWAKNLGPPDPN